MPTHKLFTTKLKRITEGGQLEEIAFAHRLNLRPLLRPMGDVCLPASLTYRLKWSDVVASYISNRKKTMILETTSEDYASLLRGCPPRSFDLADTPIAPPPVLQMLAEVAATVRETFTPASWLIIEANEVVGLCSVTRPPCNGVIDIGYGVAPSRQGRGFAGRAVADIVAWARQTVDVTALTAETSKSNERSQRVLARNGFVQVGERVDDEDGHLICWRCSAT